MFLERIAYNMRDISIGENNIVHDTFQNMFRISIMNHIIPV